MNDATSREKTADTPPQASAAEEAGGTPPQASPESGPHVVNPLTQYQFGEGEDAFSVSGVDARQGIARGALAQRYQSERDTALARSQQLEAALGGSQEENAELQQSLSRLQQREQIRQEVQAQVPPASAQPPAGEEGWFTEDTGAQPPQLNPDEIAQQISETGREVLNGIAGQNFVTQEDLAGAVAQAMQTVNSQRDMQDNATQWATERLGARVQQNVNEYGFSEADAATIAKMEDTAQLYESYGNEAAKQGDFEKAQLNYGERDKLTRQVRKAVTDQMTRHESQQKIAEMEQSLATGQFNGAPATADAEVDTSPGGGLWNNKLALRKWREGKKQAGIDRMEQANIAQAAINAEKERLISR